MTGSLRSLPPGLSEIVAELELNQPTLVSLAEVAQLALQAGLRAPPAVVADRLRRHGWLLPSGQRGMYEFVPGAHAGPYGHGDPFLTFRAARAAFDFEAAIALQSALWLLGLSDRAPNQHELAASPEAVVPQSVRRSMRVVRYRTRIAPDLINGLPVHQAASVLVHLAAKPATVQNWVVFADALGELVTLSGHPQPTMPGTPHQSAAENLLIELQGQSNAAKPRLAYLLSGVSPEVSDILQPKAAPHVIYFGPRRSSRRFSSRFNVADTLLPFDPGDLPHLGEAS